MARRLARTTVLSLIGLVVVGSATGALMSTDPPPAAPAVGPVVDTVARAERRVAEVPGDWRTLADLGLAYVERARSTGDPGYYPRAQSALERSTAVHPADNAPAELGFAALAAARHDFATALAHADRALTVDAYLAPGYGARADALIELGRYDEGFASVQRMVDLHPDASSFARASYTWELRGDTGRARAALERALAAAPDAASTTFALYQLGELAFGAGDVDGAGKRFDEGRARAPQDVTLRIGRARVLTARGQVDRALAEYKGVVTRLPNPGYLAEYGDLLAANGDPAAARAQYGLVRAGQRLLAAQGVNTDLELALFDADHDAPAAALESARAAYAARPTVFAADALAWALHVNGRSAEALPYAREAQRLGTRSALLAYHLGVIEAATGDRDGARTHLESALKLNPHFSVVHAPRARQVLATLGGAR
ncbi:tetratricopeptide repeat protein [Longispora sp. K20-0274]|uniref:tetratricopeptide repeat protein n=1 Tax=Longispora sp. K20-0274 TaxID=3088255 RepID=UPI00399BB586